MGKVMRWLKGFFGLKSDKDSKTTTALTMTMSQNSAEFRDNRASSFGREIYDGLCHNPATIPPNLSAAEAAWVRSYYTDQTEKEQSKHAIAVAAATAAAADAAVAAAQAAVAVVRLTSQGRGPTFGGCGGTSQERWASLKIQTVFRGYLARKALRALKGVVKLQAVVRGYLVRKQAAATFHSMQALIRAQATVRSHKTRSLFLNKQSHSQSRKSTENSKTEHHSRRLSATLDANFADETPKIVEVDTGRPKSRSRRTNLSISDSDYQFAAMSSPLPCRRISIPDNCHFSSYSSAASEWGLTGEECRFSTAQSTPRFCGECGGGGRMMLVAPPTPAKSVCGTGEGFYHPNYMSSTKSFKAKLRSYSAPKQRPEPAPKKRLSLNEALESTRSSMSGVRMRRSCSQVQEAFTFKNAVMGKIELRDNRNG